MYFLLCFEGIDYAGKTSVAKIVTRETKAIYGPRVAKGWVKKEETIHKNTDHSARFSFFIKEVIARSQQICRILDRANVIQDRYLLSVFAYHNLIVGRKLEAETDVSAIRQPDYTILLTVNEVALKQRMKIRPPRHRYEADPIFLLDVQREFLRLAVRDRTIIIDTSIQPTEEISNVVLREFIRQKIVHSQFFRKKR